MVSGLVLNFLSDPVGFLREAAASTAPGGVVAAYVWDYRQGMSMLRHFWDAAVEDDAGARSRDQGERFAICSPPALEAAFEAAGLADIATRPIDVGDRYHDFEEYWAPFLSGEGPAPGYLATLPEGRRERIRELVRVRLPTAAGGSIPLICRAWAIRTVPGSRAARTGARRPPPNACRREGPIRIRGRRAEPPRRPPA